MKKIILFLMVSLIPLISFAQNDGINKPFRWVGNGVWINKPPPTYQPTKGVFHVDTVANKFYIHKGSGLYDELTVSAVGPWTDSAPNPWIYRNGSVSITNDDPFSFLFDLLVDDVNVDSNTDVVFKNGVSANASTLSIQSQGVSAISLNSFGSTAPGTTLGGGNAGTSKIDGGTTMNVVATQSLNFGVPSGGLSPELIVKNDSVRVNGVLQDFQGDMGLLDQVLGNTNGRIDWVDPLVASTINLATDNLTQDLESRTYDVSNNSLSFNNAKNYNFDFGTNLATEPFSIDYVDDGKLLVDFGNTNHYLIRSQLELNAGSDNTNRVAAVLGQSVVNDTISDAVGVYGNVKNEGGLVVLQRALYAANVTNGTGNATNASGIDIQVTNTGTGVVTNGVGVAVSAVATGTMTKFTGFKIGPKSGTGIGTFLGFVNEEPTATSYTEGGWVIGNSSGLIGSQILVVDGDGINDPVKILDILQDDTATKILADDGTGIIKFRDVATIGGAADNLGNHTATQNLDLAGNKIIDSGGTLGLQINSAGLVGINTTPASARFRVQGVGSEIGIFARTNSTTTTLHTGQFVQQGTAASLFAQNTGTGNGILSTTDVGINLLMTHTEAVATTNDNKYLETSIQAPVAANIIDGFGGHQNFKLQNTTGSSNDVYRQSYEWKDATNLHGMMSISVKGGVSTINDKIFQLSSDSNGRLIEAKGRLLADERVINQNALPTDPGAINYDADKGIMNIRNAFAGSSIQVGHESVVFVVNNTGATISDGTVVHITGYDSVNDAMEIELSVADTIENIGVLGVATTEMLDTKTGLITVLGRVNDLNTSSFAEGDIVYLSSTVPGGFTATKPEIPIQVGYIGKVNATTGFLHVEIKELEKSIYGGFSHTLDQSFTANVSTPIAFNKNDEISGITHSETVSNEEFTFISGGVYQATIEPQYTRTAGGGVDVMNIFIAKDTGSGFVNVADSNIKLAVNTASVTTVSPLTSTFSVNKGDKIRFMIQVETANLILDSFAASGTAPNDIPLTPSVIMNIVRIGD